MKWIFVGGDKISKWLWRSVDSTNQYNNKPTGGLWICPYREEYPHSEWIRFSKENSWYSSEESMCSVFSLRNDARVYMINEYSDLEYIADKYELKSEYEIPMLLSSKQIDYKAMAKDYDVVFLTDKGQCETRLGKPLSLYGWDFESALILNYDVIDLESIEMVKIE